MDFEVIPAVDMKNGKCVQLIQGIPGKERVSLEDPVEAAMNWVRQGATTLHLIDLDGAIEGIRKNRSIIETIVSRTRKDITVQVGGGIRSVGDAGGLLKAGVDRVILGTAAIENPEIITELAGEFGSARIMVALDSKEGKVSVNGWTKAADRSAAEFGKIMEERGAGSILFTNIDTEGLLGGIDPRPTIDLIEAVSIPVIASGGVTTPADILELEKTGAAGVVVGSALYTGNFTLAEAINIIRKDE